MFAPGVLCIIGDDAQWEVPHCDPPKQHGRILCASPGPILATSFAHAFCLRKAPTFAFVLHADLKTWACKDRSQAACKGPDEQNINVIFSGYSELAKALPAALNEEKGAVCTDADQKWCDAQVEFMVTTTHVAKSKKEAIKMALEPGNFLEPKCKPCATARASNQPHRADARLMSPARPLAAATRPKSQRRRRSVFLCVNLERASH